MTVNIFVQLLMVGWVVRFSVAEQSERSRSLGYPGELLAAALRYRLRHQP